MLQRVWCVHQHQPQPLFSFCLWKTSKQNKHPMNIVAISFTKHSFFLALISAELIMYSNFLPVQLCGGHGKEVLHAFMLVWSHELSGEKRMANLGLSEVERITGWKPNIQTGKIPVWTCVWLCVYFCVLRGNHFCLQSLLLLFSKKNHLVHNIGLGFVLLLSRWKAV